MPKRLTQQEYCNKVYECVGDKYSVISQYQNKHSPITLHCNIHNIDFSVIAECFMRGPNDIRGKCPICKTEDKTIQFQDAHTEVTCAYCGLKFIKPNSKLLNSKSGLYF